MSLPIGTLFAMAAVVGAGLWLAPTPHRLAAQEDAAEVAVDSESVDLRIAQLEAELMELAAAIVDDPSLAEEPASDEDTEDTASVDMSDDRAEPAPPPPTDFPEPAPRPRPKSPSKPAPGPSDPLPRGSQPVVRPYKPPMSESPPMASSPPAQPSPRLARLQAELEALQRRKAERADSDEAPPAASTPTRPRSIPVATVREPAPTAAATNDESDAPSPSGSPARTNPPLAKPAPVAGPRPDPKLSPAAPPQPIPSVTDALPTLVAPRTVANSHAVPLEGEPTSVPRRDSSRASSAKPVTARTARLQTELAALRQRKGELPSSDDRVAPPVLDTAIHPASSSAPALVGDAPQTPSNPPETAIPHVAPASRSPAKLATSAVPAGATSPNPGEAGTATVPNAQPQRLRSQSTDAQTNAPAIPRDPNAMTRPGAIAGISAGTGCPTCADAGNCTVCGSASGCDVCESSHVFADDDCGIYIGLEAVFLQPHFETSDALIVNRGVPGAIATTRNFDYDFEVAPRIHAGVVGDNGFGFRFRGWHFDHSTRESAGPEDANGILNVSSAPIVPSDLPLAGGFVLETGPGERLQARHSLMMTTIDLEATQHYDFRVNTLLVSAGVRYAHVEQRYDVSRWNAANVRTGALDHDHDFEGVGPTVSAEWLHPFGDSGLSVYGNGRGSVVFGARDQTASGFAMAGPMVRQDREDQYAQVGIGEVGVGLQYSEGWFSMRAGYEGQLWTNVGSASTLAGDMGLHGFMGSIGFDF